MVSVVSFLLMITAAQFAPFELPFVDAQVYATEVDARYGLFESSH
jgi:hypothetical protein